MKTNTELNKRKIYLNYLCINIFTVILNIKPCKNVCLFQKIIMFIYKQIKIKKKFLNQFLNVFYCKKKYYKNTNKAFCY